MPNKFTVWSPSSSRSSWILPGGWMLSRGRSAAPTTTIWCPASRMSLRPATNNKPTSSPWQTSKKCIYFKINPYTNKILHKCNKSEFGPLQVPWCLWSAVPTHITDARSGEIPKDCARRSEESRRPGFKDSDRWGHHLSPQAYETATE